jgi:hypothetical protein
MEKKYRDLCIVLIFSVCSVLVLSGLIITNYFMNGRLLAKVDCACKTCDVKDNGTVSDDTDLSNRIQTIMENYYSNVGFSKKCGKKNMDDVYYPNNDNVDYAKCLEYNSISELEQYYSTFLSKNFYSNLLESNFVENDGSLYAKAHHTAPYTYEIGSFEVLSITKEGTSINAIGSYRTVDDVLYPSHTFKVNMVLIYDNDTLVLDSMTEEMEA